MDPDGKELFVNGSKAYMAAVQKTLLQMCAGATVNFDTGKVVLQNSSKKLNPMGYELLSSLVNSEKINTIWIGDSKLKNAYGNINGNSTVPYNTQISLKNGKFSCDSNIVDGGYGSMNTIINFNPDDWTGGQDDSYSTRRPPFVGLSHEFGHSEAINNGTQSYERYQYQPGTTPNVEKNSLKRENEIRIENKLTPRTYYWQPIKEGVQ